MTDVCRINQHMSQRDVDHISDCFEDFLAWCVAQGYSTETVRKRRGHLDALAKRLRQPVAATDGGTIRVRTNATNRTTETRRAHRVTVRAYLTWRLDQGLPVVADPDTMFTDNVVMPAPGSAMAVWAEYDQWMAVSEFSERTRRVRRIQVEHLEALHGSSLLDASTADLTRLLSVETWKPNTRRNYKAALSAFFKWAHQHGHVAANPADGLPRVRIPRTMVRPATEDQYVNAAVHADDPRVRMAARLAGDCGLRRREVALVAYEDLFQDPEGWCLRVHGKGGHERIVPVPDTVALDILYAQSQHPGTRWLFPSPQRPGQPLTEDHVGKLVSGQLGGGTHTLRHRAGTRAYSATRDIRAVQEFLGHAQITSTQIYTHIPDAPIRAAMNGAAAH